MGELGVVEVLCENAVCGAVSRVAGFRGVILLRFQSGFVQFLCCRALRVIVAKNVGRGVC